MEQPPVTPPNRRMVWAVRLILYPLAIVLIVVAWHARHASADNDDSGPELGTLAGHTSQGEAMTLWTADGRPESSTLRVLYSCPDSRPELAHFWLPDHHVFNRSPDRVVGDHVTTAVDGRLLHLRGQWTGSADFRTDGRLDGAAYRGTLASRVVLRYPGWPDAVCRASLSFALRALGLRRRAASRPEPRSRRAARPRAPRR
jgi:hypothetical protein